MFGLEKKRGCSEGEGKETDPYKCKTKISGCLINCHLGHINREKPLEQN